MIDYEGVMLGRLQGTQPVGDAGPKLCEVVAGQGAAPVDIRCDEGFVPHINLGQAHIALVREGEQLAALPLLLHEGDAAS